MGKHCCGVQRERSGGLALKTLRKAENTGLPLLALAAIRELKCSLESLELAQIDSARDKGASWEDIAEAMGVTRQALQQRLRHRRPEGAEGTEIRLPD